MAEMDPFEVLVDIPDDPEAGLLEIHNRLCHLFNDAPENSEERRSIQEMYAVAIDEWIKSNGLTISSEYLDIDSIDIGDPDTLDKLFRHNQKLVNIFLKGLQVGLRREKIRSALANPNTSMGYTRLSPDEKKVAHDYLAKIREIIEGSDIETRKRNSFYSKINELSAEIDRAGTKTEAFMGFLLEASLVAGKLGENAAPFMKAVKGMVKTLARSRAKEVGVALPPGEEISLITDESED